MSSMCQRCSKVRATVHVVDTAPQRKEWHLCEDCAEKEGVIVKQHHATSNLILQEFIKQKSGTLGEDLSCSECGMTFKEFQNKGLLGCPHDYVAFRNILLRLIERAHGSKARHVGKVPRDADLAIRKQTGLLRLRRELQEAIDQENYERAAHVRDQIKDME
ncbi:MAG: UvrB/UvrC motif-containing protein [Planctomycetota bacterium]